MWSEGSSAGSRILRQLFLINNQNQKQKRACTALATGSLSTWPCHVLQVVQPVPRGQRGCAEGSRTCPILLELIIKIAAGFQSS